MAISGDENRNCSIIWKAVITKTTCQSLKEELGINVGKDVRFIFVKVFRNASQIALLQSVPQGFVNLRKEPNQKHTGVTVMNKVTCLFASMFRDIHLP